MSSSEFDNKLEPTEWVDKYADYLYSYAITRVKNKIIVEDLVQETFLSALKAKDKFLFKSTVRTWLTSILRNKIFDYYKKSSKMDLSLSEMPDFNTDYFEKGGFGTKWSEDAINIWELENEDVNSDAFEIMLKQCLNNLSESQQAVFSMKNMEGFDAEEICKVLNISSSNYWVIIHRSKLRLRKCVQLNWFNSKDK